MVSDILIVLALVFLGLHLLTDARRLAQVLKIQHDRKVHRLNLVLPSMPMPCSRCGAWDASLKEAWWEVLTFVVLVGHITLDYI